VYLVGLHICVKFHVYHHVLLSVFVYKGWLNARSIVLSYCLLFVNRGRLVPNPPCPTVCFCDNIVSNSASSVSFYCVLLFWQKVWLPLSSSPSGRLREKKEVTFVTFITMSFCLLHIFSLNLMKFFTKMGNYITSPHVCPTSNT
jgi:hypothetical protein